MASGPIYMLLMELKAYCSILRLSCMGKVVQKVLAELLPVEAER